jgi:hypothetical protein
MKKILTLFTLIFFAHVNGAYSNSIQENPSEAHITELPLTAEQVDFMKEEGVYYPIPETRPDERSLLNQIYLSIKDNTVVKATGVLRGALSTMP